MVREDGRTRRKIYAPLCGGLYKEEYGYLVPWSGTDPDFNMKCFTCTKGENYWIVPGDQFNEEFKNWWGNILIGQLLSKTLNESRKTEATCTKCAGSAEFSGIPREVKSEIPIKYCYDQYRDHMISNGIYDVFSLPDPHNKEKKWDILPHQSTFPLEYIKYHINILQKGSTADQ